MSKIIGIDLGTTNSVVAVMMWKLRSKSTSLPTPGRTGRQARAQLREPREGQADLKWSGGKAGRG